jgi:hypothetical protein
MDGTVWMKRLQETHILRKAALDALDALRHAQRVAKRILPQRARDLQRAMGFVKTS